MDLFLAQAGQPHHVIRRLVRCRRRGEIVLRGGRQRRELREGCGGGGSKRCLKRRVTVRGGG
jgi:hypothetical protein